MTTTQTLVAALALLLVFILLSFVDREQPGPPRDTDAEEARRYLAEKDQDDD